MMKHLKRAGLSLLFLLSVLFTNAQSASYKSDRLDYYAKVDSACTTYKGDYKIGINNIHYFDTLTITDSKNLNIVLKIKTFYPSYDNGEVTVAKYLGQDSYLLNVTIYAVWYKGKIEKLIYYTSKSLLVFYINSPQRKL